MSSWHELNRDGTRLACREFGGAGSSVLLLHGLAGHAGEWEETASWLKKGCRVFASDARGHGRSERLPVDVGPEAHVADTAFLVEQLGIDPVVLVGQSLGGVGALLVAARHPELVRALVLVDASPAGGPREAETASDAVGESLRRWRVPFSSRASAYSFFEQKYGGKLAAQAWTEGLERREDGWWPRFDVDVLVRTLREFVVEPRWAEWESISCPTVVVRAGHGVVDAKTAAAMKERLPSASLVEVPDAAHDLHLDRPDEWRAALLAFLDSLST